MKKIQVFFINKNEFLNSLEKDYLLSFLDGKEFKSQKRVEEYCLGRFLIKQVLEKFFDIKNPEIIVENKKPCLKQDANVFFSLSHSEEVVLCAFSTEPVGADVEFMKDRDFKKLSKRYGLPVVAEDKKTFYKFWTEYEASLKLQSEPKSKITIQLPDSYLLTVCSAVEGFTEDDVSVLKLFTNTLND